MAAPDALIARAEALLDRLDDGDPRGIQTAAAELRDAAAAIATLPRGPETRARLNTALATLDAAGARANYLADRTRRRLDRLAALTGAPRAVAYGRRGGLA